MALPKFSWFPRCSEMKRFWRFQNGLHISIKHLFILGHGLTIIPTEIQFRRIAMKRVIGTVIFALIISTSSYAAEPKLKWLGHAAFQYSSREGKIFLVDPWLSNPK